MSKEIKEYFEKEALSQSKLKILLGNNPKKFLEKEEQATKTYFIIGSAVDCLLTQGKESFEEEFYVSQIDEKLSDLMCSILEDVFKSTSTLLDYDVVIESCNKFNYQKNWKDLTRYNKIMEYSSYFDELVSSKGKTLLSKEEKVLIDSIVLSFETSDIYKDNILNLKEGEEILYQLPIYFTFADEKCKALLDIVKINHKENTVEIYDIKTTTNDVLDFPLSAKRFRYDIQLAFYKEAMISYLQDKGMFMYTIKKCSFLVESTTNIGNPCEFICSDSFLYYGKHTVEHSPTEKVKGFEELIEDYKYYKENGFSTHIEIKERKNKFVL